MSEPHIDDIEKTDATASKDVYRTTTNEKGIVEAIDDPDVRDFYGQSVNDSYRLKSELVSKELANIGMGRYARFLLRFTDRCCSLSLSRIDILRSA